MGQTLAPQQVVAHYRVTGALGAGGMGEVYLARDLTLDRDVAIKILPPALVGDARRLRRFVQEAKAASSLNHPNIVTIHEIGEAEALGANGCAPAGEAAGRVHFIAMEYVDGLTLADAIHQDRTDLKTLVDYLAQAAEGLAKAHAAGIVHRDLKPGNIMVSKDGFAKVLDFGLAKLTERTSSGDDTTVAPQTDLTGEGVVVGTTGYMSPEQVAGKTVDARSDIFSFGCILYEAATRQRPFVGETGIDTLHKILNDAPRPVEEINPRVPAELRRVVRRCLAKSPDQRYQSIKDVAIELREIVGAYETLPISGASRSGAAAVATRRPRRGWWLAAGVAGALIVAVLVAGWVMRPRLRPTAQPAGGAAEPVKFSTILDREDFLALTLSPDARYLAYTTMAGNTYGIRVRQVATGSDVPVLEPRQGFVGGLTFTADGNYLYFLAGAPGASVYDTLFTVPSLGGTPRKIQDGEMSAVAFSPDGKRFAFVKLASSTTGQFVVSDLASGSQRVVATFEGSPENACERIAWSPDGREIRMVFGRPQGPMVGDTEAVAFDVETGARRVLGTWKSLSPYDATWLPGNAIIVSGNEPGMGTPLQLWRLEYPAGTRRRLTSDQNQYLNASASADGTQVAAIRASNTWDLWSVAASGAGQPRRLPLGVKRPAAPVVRGDGTTLVFELRYEDDDSIWSAGTDGSGLRRITPPAVSPGAFRVLPSNDAIVFDGFRAGEVSHIWRIAMDGGGLVQLTDGSGETLVDLAPDGRECLYSSRTGETNQLRRLRLDEAAGPAMIAAGLFWNTSYSPDGKLVGYLDPRLSNDRWTVPIVIVPREGGGPIATLDVKANTGPSTWGADASGYVYLVQDRSFQAVMQQPVAGGAPTPLFRLPAGYHLRSLKWSHDRRTLLISAFIDRISNLWTWTLGGGAPRQLTHFPTGSIYCTAWSPDGKTVYFCQGHSTQDVVLIRGLK